MAARGSQPRGFSLSINALKGGKTRVIMWRRRATGGGVRKKLLDVVMDAGQTYEVAPPVVGGLGNRRKIMVSITAEHVAEGVE